jgi:tetratricopeptide (TPR) repeat protein
MRKFLPILLILLTFVTSGYRKPDTYVIDATKNAYLHNNMGLRYINEHCYYAAIQEFKIAISLNPNTQGTAVYYNNIGDAYMLIGYPQMAQQPYEDALKQYGLNLKYYKDLAKCYKALGLISAKMSQYSSTDNPLNKVMLGLLYIESGDLKHGVIILDEFTMKEPDLLITPAIKQYIKEVVKQINS